MSGKRAVAANLCLKTLYGTVMLKMGSSSGREEQELPVKDPRPEPNVRLSTCAHVRAHTHTHTYTHNLCDTS